MVVVFWLTAVSFVGLDNAHAEAWYAGWSSRWVGCKLLGTGSVVQWSGFLVRCYLLCGERPAVDKSKAVFVRRLSVSGNPCARSTDSSCFWKTRELWTMRHLMIPAENVKQGWRTPPRRRCREAWLGVGGNLMHLPRCDTLRGNLEQFCR